jgi:hypothetical protein
LTIRNSEPTRGGVSSPAIRWSQCTLRVCGRKNYRLQDIQLSKIIQGTASPGTPHAVGHADPSIPAPLPRGAPSGAPNFCPVARGA